MRPTFDTHDIMLAEAISYKYFSRPLKVGDVVIFTSPENGRDLLLKRITALVSDCIPPSPHNINRLLFACRKEIKFDLTKVSNITTEKTIIIE